MHVRPARLDDWDNGLCEIVAQLLDVPDSWKHPFGFEDILMGPNSEMFVVETVEALIGCGVGHVIPQPLGRPSLLVETIVVDENQRRQGAGRLLILELMQFATQRNCYKMFGLMRPGSEPFYRSFSRIVVNSVFEKVLT